MIERSIAVLAALFAEMIIPGASGVDGPCGPKGKKVVVSDLAGLLPRAPGDRKTPSSGAERLKVIRIFSPEWTVNVPSADFRYVRGIATKY